MNCAETRKPAIELLKAPRSLLDDAAKQAAFQPTDGEENWFQYTLLPDGSSYLRWPGLYQFLVSPDGRRILGRSIQQSISRESFHTYLLGAALSFSLIKLGFDPLHATVLAANGSSFGLMGKSGYGKSTLAGAFLQAGYSVVTDDLLVLKKDPAGFSAYPGPPRIKLYPTMAKALLDKRVAGVRMNPMTRKLIIPLSAKQSLQTKVPLNALYVLNTPSPSVRNITIRLLSPRRALVVLLENSFNIWVDEQSRLKLQFLLYTQIASQIPVKRISYPRHLTSLPAVRDAILKDLAKSNNS